MLTGIILANGTSKRMNGENKSLLTLGGEVLIQRQIREMKTICDEMIIVTNSPRLYLRLVDESVRIITDYYPNQGPLSGMHAGLMLSRNEIGWVAGWDMPFISAEAARYMLGMKHVDSEAVIPVIGGQARPLHGIFSKSCASKIETLLMNNLTDVSSLLDVVYWQPAMEEGFQQQAIDTGFIATIKTAEDYYTIMEQLAGRSAEHHEHGACSPAPG